jgi:hypothetical protein
MERYVTVVASFNIVADSNLLRAGKLCPIELRGVVPTAVSRFRVAIWDEIRCVAGSGCKGGIYCALQRALEEALAGPRAIRIRTDHKEKGKAGGALKTKTCSRAGPARVARTFQGFADTLEIGPLSSYYISLKNFRDTY